MISPVSFSREKGPDGVTTLTAPLDRPRVAPTAPSPDRPASAPAGAPGLAAALVVSGWILFFDRRVAQPSLWASIAAALAFLALSWPITRRGWLRRFALAAVELVVLVAVAGVADRAIAAWEERVPRFGAASTVASGALNLLGYRAAAEDGLLLLDHPDGLVTIVPSMEKLGARELLLFGVAWAVLWLVRDFRRSAAAAVVGLGVLLAVGMQRYVVLLLIYAEHDDILAGGTGLVALDRFASPWIASGFLVLAGLVADRVARWAVVGEVAGSVAAPVRPGRWGIIGGCAAVAALAGLSAFGASFCPPGAEKSGRILVDDRYCGIWEPTARQLDTEW